MLNRLTDKLRGKGKMLAGLDVGAGAVKAVVITISDGIPEVRAVRLLRCQAEGFVD
jgi:hypothetical protein